MTNTSNNTTISVSALTSFMNNVTDKTVSKKTVLRIVNDFNDSLNAFRRSSYLNSAVFCATYFDDEIGKIEVKFDPKYYNACFRIDDGLSTKPFVWSVVLEDTPEESVKKEQPMFNTNPDIGLPKRKPFVGSMLDDISKSFSCLSLKRKLKSATTPMEAFDIIGAHFGDDTTFSNRISSKGVTYNYSLRSNDGVVKLSIEVFTKATDTNSNILNLDLTVTRENIESVYNSIIGLRKMFN